MSFNKLAIFTSLLFYLFLESLLTHKMISFSLFRSHHARGASSSSAVAFLLIFSTCRRLSLYRTFSWSLFLHSHICHFLVKYIFKTFIFLLSFFRCFTFSFFLFFFHFEENDPRFDFQSEIFTLTLRCVAQNNFSFVEIKGGSRVSAKNDSRWFVYVFDSHDDAFAFTLRHFSNPTFSFVLPAYFFKNTALLFEAMAILRCFRVWIAEKTEGFFEWKRKLRTIWGRQQMRHKNCCRERSLHVKLLWNLRDIICRDQREQRHKSRHIHGRF